MASAAPFAPMVGHVRQSPRNARNHAGHRNPSRAAPAARPTAMPGAASARPPSYPNTPEHARTPAGLRLFERINHV